MRDYQFGDFLLSLREVKGITQAELGDMLGVTAAAVSKWETGESKPRTEILFKLAGIYGVRAEELMAGHRMDAAAVRPEIIEEINRRYEYLQRIDTYTSFKVKIFRCLAFLIDWYLFGAVIMICIGILYPMFKSDSVAIEIKAPIVIILVLTFFISVILRDLIFGGVSLGKRIFRLTIIDREDGGKVKPWQLFVRNLFLFIYSFDAIVMFICGQKIGDFAAHTVVVEKSKINNGTASENKAAQAELVNSYKSPVKTPIWALFLTAVVILFMFSVMMVVVLIKIKQHQTL